MQVDGCRLKIQKISDAWGSSRYLSHAFSATFSGCPPCLPVFCLLSAFSRMTVQWQFEQEKRASSRITACRQCEGEWTTWESLTVILASWLRISCAKRSEQWLGASRIGSKPCGRQWFPDIAPWETWEILGRYLDVPPAHGAQL